MCFSLYSLGDTPVYSLKYFRKVNCSGKFNSCATSLILVRFWRKSFLAWLIVTSKIHSDGVQIVSTVQSCTTFPNCWRRIGRRNYLYDRCFFLLLKHHLPGLPTLPAFFRTIYTYYHYAYNIFYAIYISYIVYEKGWQGRQPRQK